MYVSNNYFVIHYVILTVLSPCMSCFGITYLYLRLVILRACPTAVYDVTVHTYSGITYVHNLLVIVSIQTTIHTCSKRMQLKYSTSALFFNCQHNYCTCTYVNDTTSRYTHCLVTVHVLFHHDIRLVKHRACLHCSCTNVLFQHHKQNLLTNIDKSSLSLC